MPVQVLQKKFEEFKRDISVSTERYTAVNGLARRLVAEGHSDTVLIKEKQDAMRWATIGNDVLLVIVYWAIRSINLDVWSDS